MTSVREAVNTRPEPKARKSAISKDKASKDKVKPIVVKASKASKSKARAGKDRFGEGKASPDARAAAPCTTRITRARTQRQITHPEFHLFPKLPIELRLKIWTEALPEPRMVEIRTEYDPQDNMVPLTGYAWYPECIEVAPSLFFVNRESRYEVSKFYTPLRNLEIIRKGSRRSRVVYVDFKTDYFCFLDPRLGRDTCLGVLCGEMGEVWKSIKRIAVDAVLLELAATCTHGREMKKWELDDLVLLFKSDATKEATGPSTTQGPLPEDLWTEDGKPVTGFKEIPEDELTFWEEMETWDIYASLLHWEEHTKGLSLEWKIPSLRLGRVVEK